jgi:predicted Zn finger-like uncharacterized protein
MKFQCDRCKTRYSIAEERVRGKILKIRCKNCEAVITVREGMDAPSARESAVKPAAQPAAAAAASKAASKPGGRGVAGKADGRVTGPTPSIASKPVLRGAFERAMEPGAAPANAFDADDQTEISKPAPKQLEEEWYVSLDGEQFGPFNLTQAREWVGTRNRDEELFCWTEGFDDWLPIEKVAHFRRLRTDEGGSASAPLPRPPPPRPSAPQAAMSAKAGSGPVGMATARKVEEPKPLFAAALAEMERGDHSEPVEKMLKDASSGPVNGNGGGNGKGLLDQIDDLDDESSREGAFDFDIGEASRVVKLPALAAALRPRSAGSSGSSLPGMGGAAAVDPASRIGNGTGGQASVGRMTGGMPVVSRARWGPILAGENSWAPRMTH